MLIKASQVNYIDEPYIMDQLEEEANLEYDYESQQEALENRGMSQSDFI